MKKTSLLYHTFDGQLKNVTVTPNAMDSTCAFNMDVIMPDSGESQNVTITFTGVAALEFSINFCDSAKGANLGGFYKVPSKKQKRKLLERNFKRRKKGWVMTQMRNAEAEDPDSVLNNHEEVDKLEAELKKYSMFLLESTGGAWLILATGYETTGIESQEEAAPAEDAPALNG